jgi:hypothetical protein
MSEQDQEDLGQPNEPVQGGLGEQLPHLMMGGASREQYFGMLLGPDSTLATKQGGAEEEIGVAGRDISELAKPTGTPDLKKLEERVSQLEQEMEDALGAILPDDRPKVFFAIVDTANKWNETIVDNGTVGVVDPGGRACTAADDSRLITLDGSVPPDNDIGLMVETLDQKGSRFVYFSGSSRNVLIALTGNSKTGGVYTAREWKMPTADVSVSGSTFSSSTLGSDPGSDDGYFFNLAEIGQTTHDLTSASPAIVLLTARLWYTNSNGKKIYTAYVVAPGC